MKIMFYFFLLNLFIFTTTNLLLTAASDVIYDSAGNKLLTGVPYYVLPLLRGSGGGLTLTRDGKNGCPLNVTQEPFEVNHGVPVTFNPIVLDEESIRASYPTSVEADIINPCSGSTIWKVSTAEAAKGDEDGHSNKDHKKKDDDDKKVAAVKIVTTGGEFNTPESCFQIVEDDIMPGLQSYQIQHCPFKCGSSKSVLTCYNIGVVSDADGKNYLAPTDALFPVVFSNSLGTFSRSAKPSKFIQSPKMSIFSQWAK